MQQRWLRLLEKFDKDSQTNRETKKLYNACNEWVKRPDCPSAFNSFFSKLLGPRESGASDKVGGEGKYRKATGSALEWFVYRLLKPRLPEFFLGLDVPIDDRLSLTPDISIWKNNNPCLLVECKVGCDLPTLRAVAMEKYLLQRMGKTADLFVVTRSDLEKRHRKRSREFEILSEFVDIHYLPIEIENSGKQLEDRVHRFLTGLEKRVHEERL